LEKSQKAKSKKSKKFRLERKEDGFFVSFVTRSTIRAARTARLLSPKGVPLFLLAVGDLCLRLPPKPPKPVAAGFEPTTLKGAATAAAPHSHGSGF